MNLETNLETGLVFAARPGFPRTGFCLSPVAGSATVKARCRAHSSADTALRLPQSRVHFARAADLFHARRAE